MFTLHTLFLVQIIMEPSFICCVVICRTAPNKTQILHSFVYGTVLLFVEGAYLIMKRLAVAPRTY